MPQVTVTRPAHSQQSFQQAHQQQQPSPVASEAESAHPLTSTALRDHDPAAVYAQNQQLSPKKQHHLRHHGRSPSGGSIQSDSDTVPDSYTVYSASSPPSPSPAKKRSIDLEAGPKQSSNEPSPPQAQQQPAAAASTNPDKSFLRKLMFWKKDDQVQLPGSGKGDGASEEEKPAQKIPDPSPEAMGRFSVKPSQLDEMFNPKSMENLEALGGTEGVAETLFTSLKDGLDEQKPSPAFEERHRAYGKNLMPPRKTKGLLRLMWMAVQDKILIILIIAAIVSLALGLYQSIGTPPEIINGEPQPQVEWVEGVVSTSIHFGGMYMTNCVRRLSWWL